jgi:hypothetical protein
VFTDCQAQGRALTLADGRTVPMKCHWTGSAEMALAVPLLATGTLMAGSRRRETLRNLSLLGAVLGAVVILLPTALIGVCANPDMLCNSVMRPTLILGGSLVVVLGLVGLVRSWRQKEELA